MYLIDPKGYEMDQSNDVVVVYFMTELIRTGQLFMLESGIVIIFI